MAAFVPKKGSAMEAGKQQHDMASQPTSEQINKQSRKDKTPDDGDGGIDD